MYKNTLETTPIKYKTYKLPKTQTRIGMGLCLLPMAIGVLPPVCGSPNDGVAGQIILFSFFFGSTDKKPVPVFERNIILSFREAPTG
jgi:hypothetical protein